VKVGIGYDSHRFLAGRRLVLGGIEIPAEQGLSGHSDADVVTHAVMDALLGAAALGDIGSHFPPDDPRWRDADSMRLLQRVGSRVTAAGGRVVNIDVTVICETPRLAPYVEAMRSRLAEALGIEVARVSVKGKSNEGMGWIGRGEGVAALAAALLDGMDG
jgi:2-C-methyl-D-erythritol 2,4-cyclodiphosphate synthase